MIWSKSHKLKVIALGAINGILFGVSMETVLRSLFLYEKYLRGKEPLSPNLHISYLPYPFNWWFLPLLSFVFVTLATFIVHRYFAQYIKSSIWFWQVVGVVAVLGLVVYSIPHSLYTWCFSIFDFSESYYSMEAIQQDLPILLIAFPSIALFNLLFALVLKWRKLNLP